MAILFISLRLLMQFPKIELAMLFSENGLTLDKLVKSRHEDHRWLDKKVDIQGVVFLAGSRLYTWYVESLPKTYNEGDRAFYDAINA